MVKLKRMLQLYINLTSMNVKLFNFHLYYLYCFLNTTVLTRMCPKINKLHLFSLYNAQYQPIYTCVKCTEKTFGCTKMNEFQLYYFIFHLILLYFYIKLSTNRSKVIIFQLYCLCLIPCQVLCILCVDFIKRCLKTTISELNCSILFLCYVAKAVFEIKLLINLEYYTKNGYNTVFK